MKKISVIFIVFILAGSLLMGQADQRKRVAIMDFDFSTIQHWWSGNWDIGKGVSDLIVKDLVTDGSYRVIERRALDAILAEQNFSNSDRANPSTAAAIGKILGVDAIILGSITQFGVEDKSLGIGGFGRTIGGFGIGRIGTKEGIAKVVVDARIVDINTSEILGVAEGSGESTRKGLLLAGSGGGSSSGHGVTRTENRAPAGATFPVGAPRTAWRRLESLIRLWRHLISRRPSPSSTSQRPSALISG